VIDIISTPGHLTAGELDAASLARLSRHGYAWVSYQAQNGDTYRDFDLRPAEAAGLSPGVWGVTYDPDRFYDDGHRLGVQALVLGARHVQMDAEMCAKRTRTSRGLKPIVQGIRDAGWTGSVHLNTLGAPDNPDVNDYEVDTETFLETGGGVFCQAYFNANDGYRPSLCVRYWTRAGVHPGRLNVLIGLHRSEVDQRKPGVRLAGAEWVPLLAEAGVERNFSVFMAEFATEEDLEGLDPLSLAPPSQPPAPTTKGTRATIVDAAKTWEAGQLGPTPRTIITICRRLAQASTTPKRRDAIVDRLLALLNEAGIEP